MTNGLINRRNGLILASAIVMSFIVFVIISSQALGFVDFNSLLTSGSILAISVSAVIILGLILFPKQNLFVVMFVGAYIGSWIQYFSTTIINPGGTISLLNIDLHFGAIVNAVLIIGAFALLSTVFKK